MGGENKFIKNINKLPNEVRDTSLMAQYRLGTITLAAHYHYLRQLQAIYAVIACKISSSSFKATLPPELREELIGLLKREQLADDIAFLRPYMLESDHQAPLVNTTFKYIEYLNKLNLEAKDCKDVLLAHLLVQVLNNAANSALLKSDVQQLYLKEKIIVDAESDQGVSFYAFHKKMSESCDQWLDALLSSEQFVDQEQKKLPMVSVANYAISIHMKIFDELKGEQMVNVKYGRFFAMTVIAATVAVIGGAAYALNMLDNEQSLKLGN